MVRRVIPFLALILGLLSPEISYATTYNTGIQSDFEPVIGYERVQKLVPTPHTSDRLVYGARAWLGFPLVAVETEYLHGTDSEIFSSPSMTTTDTDEKVKLGLRSQIRMGSLLSFVLRAGAQGKQTKHDENISGVTTSTTSGWIYSPYAGAGLHVGLMKHLSFTAEVVAVFSDYRNSWTKNEYQATAGFTIHFP